MDRGSWQVIVDGVAKESDATEHTLLEVVPFELDGDLDEGCESKGESKEMGCCLPRCMRAWIWGSGRMKSRVLL